MKRHVHIINAGIDHVQMTYCNRSLQHSIKPGHQPELTFTITATPYEGRSIVLYEIYFGDENFIPVSPMTSHTYLTPGSIAVRDKVTDNTGEYSISTSSLAIADFTTEEKISQAYEEGKQYVQNNSSEFGLLTTVELNQTVADAEAACSLIISSRDLTIIDLNEEISSLNEIMSTMYTQEEFNSALNKAKTDADFFCYSCEGSLS